VVEKGSDLVEATEVYLARQFIS